MAAYYNEIDPHAAAWLAALIAAGHIAPGDVDKRSITEVHPDDLRGYTQCHFFAGIGGWSYALRLAGWPDDRPIWTGSCPCQPFSAAGAQRGSEDERHLWPAFWRLIRECRPSTVLGEQVAGSAGYAWWDHVAADLESAGYAAAASNIGAHSVRAPHIRQRLYWVAHAADKIHQRIARPERDSQCFEEGHKPTVGISAARFVNGCADGLLAHADGGHPGAEGLQRSGQHRQQSQDGGAGALANNNGRGRGEFPLEELLDGQRQTHWNDADRCGTDGFLGNAGNAGLEGHGADSSSSGWSAAPRSTTKAGGLDAWRDIEWIACSDGKARPTQPGISPLVDGLPKGMGRGSDSGAPIDANATPEARVMRLRGYGNAIVPQLAAAFVLAVTDGTRPARPEGR